MHRQYVLAILALLPLVIASTTEDVPVGWLPIPSTSDPQVLVNAKFAVAEYNKKTIHKLVFQNVVGGKVLSSVAAGQFYDLTIAAKNESLPTSVANYQASVWDDFAIGRIRQLNGFRKA